MKRESCKILVINLGNEKDVIASLSVLPGLKQQYLDSSISYLVRSEFKNILETNPYLEKVFSYDPFKIEQKETISHTLQRIEELIKLLQQEKFKLVINLENSKESATIAYLSHGDFAKGMCLDDLGRYHFFDKWSEYLHISRGIKSFVLSPSQIYRLIADVEAEAGMPLWVLEREETAFAKEFFRYHNISEMDLVVGIYPEIHLNRFFWGEKNFARLNDKLNKEYKVKTVLIGSEDKNALDKIYRLSERKPFIAFFKEIRKKKAIISKCHLLITSKPSAAYLAEMVGTENILILGPTYDLPEGHTLSIVLHADLPCYPCEYFCQSMVCFDKIRVEDVVTAFNIYRSIKKTGSFSKQTKERTDNLNGVRILYTMPTLKGSSFDFIPYEKIQPESLNLIKRILDYCHLWAWMNADLEYPFSQITNQKIISISKIKKKIEQEFVFQDFDDIINQLEDCLNQLDRLNYLCDEMIKLSRRACNLYKKKRRSSLTLIQARIKEINLALEDFPLKRYLSLITLNEEVSLDYLTRFRLIEETFIKRKAIGLKMHSALRGLIMAWKKATEVMKN